MTDPTPPTEPTSTPPTPPAASSPTPPASPSPVSGSGSGPRPGEKVREPVAVIIFSIITLGIYHVYWIYQVFRELKERTGEGIGPIIGLVLAIVINPVNWFVLPSEVGNMYAAAGKEKPVSGVTGFWNLIPLIGFIIWVVKVQGALNRAWEGAV
jgi:hypothetical protein